MTDELLLPLSVDALPPKVQRFGAPDAPTPAKTMAAKGLVPVTGDDLVTLMVQLSADANADVRNAAAENLSKMPESVLEPSCSSPLHPAILHGLLDHVGRRRPLLEALAGNRSAHDQTILAIAATGHEVACERIATDQVRLLRFPAIIEALYKNKHTRMSTVDRLVELAARNGVELSGVSSFAAHVEAIQGQLIIDEPTDEPLPDDQAFNDALQDDADDHSAVEQDKVDGTESVKESFKPLATRIANMNTAAKVRLSVVGNAAARALLVRDSNKLVAMAAISSPSMKDGEAASIATSRQVTEDILRYIGNRKEWLGNYLVKRNLTFNPKTPVAISLRFLSHLRQNDLRMIAKSKNVPAALRRSAVQRLAKSQRT